MLSLLGGMIDGVSDFTEGVVNSLTGASEAAVNGIMNGVDATFQGVIRAGSTLMDTSISLTLPLVKTGGELYLSGLVGGALVGIPGPVGAMAQIYDAADTALGVVRTGPELINEISDNFAYRPTLQKTCDRCHTPQPSLLGYDEQMLCSSCFGESLARSTAPAPRLVPFQASLEIKPPSLNLPASRPMFQPQFPPTVQINLQRCARCGDETTALFADGWSKVCLSCYTRK